MSFVVLLIAPFDMGDGLMPFEYDDGGQRGLPSAWFAQVVRSRPSWPGLREVRGRKALSVVRSELFP